MPKVCDINRSLLAALTATGSPRVVPDLLEEGGEGRAAGALLLQVPHHPPPLLPRPPRSPRRQDEPGDAGGCGGASACTWPPAPGGPSGT